jgi:hypothetical protein
MDMRPQGGKDVLGPSEPLQWPGFGGFGRKAPHFHVTFFYFP